MQTSSITLSPIQYPRLIKRTFTVLNVENFGLKLEIDIPSVSNSRLFYGKKVPCKIVTKTGIVDTQAIYTIENLNNQVKHYLLPQDQVNVASGDTIIIYETFAISNDEQVATISDVYENCKPTESEVREYGESKVGRSGLITGTQNLKINQTLYDFRKEQSITLTNSFVTVNTVRIDKEKLSRYRLLLYPQNRDSSRGFEAEFIFAPDAEYCQVRLNSQMPLKLRLTKTSYFEEPSFVKIELALTTSNEYSFSGFIGCKSYKDLMPPTTTRILDTASILLNGKDVVECFPNLLTVDTYGEQHASYPKETIFKSADLTGADLIVNQTPGYYKVKSNRIADLPGAQSDISKYGSDGKGKPDIDWNSGNLIIYPSDGNISSCLLVTDKNQIFTGIINRTENTVVWKSLVDDTHKHKATEIIEDSDHKFVSTNQINTWNSTNTSQANSPWKQTVTTESDLPTSVNKVGTVITVTKSTRYPNKSVIYQWSGTAWIPVGNNVLPIDVENQENLLDGIGGSLISPERLSKLNASGIGYFLNSKPQVVFSGNSKSIYTNTGDSVFFDLIKRELPNPITPGDKSINFGFYNDEAGENSVFLGSKMLKVSNDVAVTNTVSIGYGLTLGDEQIVLGKWNIPNTEHKLIIGDGTSSNLKSNALWLTKNNNLVIKSGKFEIENVGPSMILTSGGTIDSNTLVTTENMNNVLRTKADSSNYVIFKHEPKNPSDTVKEIHFVITSMEETV